MAVGRPRSNPTAADKAVLDCVNEYRREAFEAREPRLRQTRENWNVYLGQIDWTHKQEGQSTEHLPKLSNSAENMSAFIRRALTQFGPWFSVEGPRNSVLSPEQIRALIMRFLETLPSQRGKTTDFSTVVGDAVKQALLESLLIFKVHGCYIKERSFRVEPGNMLAGVQDKLATEENEVWRLRIDLIPSEDYYPDPTGRGLYEIHRVERDYADVLAMAEGDYAIYDKAEVQRIREDADRDESRLKETRRGVTDSAQPKRRKRVILDEVWGTILDEKGEVLHENIVTTIANEKYVIRKPTENPCWDGESPIIAVPISRVPHTVWHRALFDNVAGLNLALDELFNLILDGGIASVWGVRQIREDWLADPRQVSNGVPAGATLVLSEDAPADAEVMKVVASGKVPPEAVTVFGITDREAAQAAFSNDVRLGNLPQRQVKATELVQAEQNSSVLLDAFAGDLEREAIAKVLRKSWLSILQFADDIPAADVVDAIGAKAAFRLASMSEAQRWAMFAQGIKFKVSGLSGTLAKAREFQKLMAMNQGVATNPLLLQAYLQRFSGDKMLTHIMRSLNINPEDLQMSEEEQEKQAETQAEVMQMAQITGGGTPATGDGGTGTASSTASIQQDAAPTSGVG